MSLRGRTISKPWMTQKPVLSAGYLLFWNKGMIPTWQDPTNFPKKSENPCLGSYWERPWACAQSHYFLFQPLEWCGPCSPVDGKQSWHQAQGLYSATGFPFFQIQAPIPCFPIISTCAWFHCTIFHCGLWLCALSCLTHRTETPVQGRRLS